MLRVVTWTVAIALLIAGGVWVLRPATFRPLVATTTQDGPDDEWLDHLYSQNPRDAEAATGWVQQIGKDAMPLVRSTLKNPAETLDRKKAALKACSLIMTAAADAIPDVAPLLVQPELTAEAAAALSFMGPDAFQPLSMVATHANADVRREALRGLGKLQKRGPLDPGMVVPLLLGGIVDEDGSVRAVAATYLGIVKAAPETSVPALTTALGDPEVPVRLAAAAALEHFGEAALPALPALKKASADKDEDVAREAGRAVVTLSELMPPALARR